MACQARSRYNEHFSNDVFREFFSNDVFQMTASIDLVQTHFKCCAINSNLNYDMSLWRLQNFGQRDWIVPQTCCILANDHDDNPNRSYLDPKPQNLTLCQSLLKHEYNRGRHKDNCLEHLVTWYSEHYNIFFTAGGIFVLVQFIVLLSIIFSCTKIAAHNKRKRTTCRSTGTTMQTNVLAHNIKRPAPQPQFQQPSKASNVYSYNLSNSFLV